MTSPASLFQLCTRCGVRLPDLYRADACDCGNRRIWRAPPGAGIEAAAAGYHMRRPRALRLLQLGLDRYADFA